MTNKEPESAASDGRPGAWVAAAVYLALAIAYFLPAFAVGRHIYGSDYLAGAYFAHDFISERFAAGALPKWVPFLYGGLPLFANPGSAFYPFRFLADLIFPTSRIFPTLYVIQFTLAGVGMYWLSRELGARRWIAFVAGLAFQFTGLTMSFVLAGHDGRIIVATFAPLFLFFLARGIRTGRILDFGGMAAVLGTSLLSFQIQSNYYLLLGGAAWAAFLLVRRRSELSRRALTRRFGLGLAAVVVAFGMAAVNFLPFADYVDASPRGGPGRGYEYATSWSMPPGELTGVALPEASGVLEHYRGENPFKLHTEYVGAVVVLLLLVGAWANRRDPRWWFFALLALFGLSISFGGHTPIYRLYYALLPGTAKFRAPSIAFFLVSVSLVVMAALTLERLARLRTPGDGAAAAPEDGERGRVSWVLVGASVLALLVLLAVAGQAGVDERGRALARGAFRLAGVTWLGAGALWLWLRGTLDGRVVAGVLAVLVVADLWSVDRRFFETVDPPETMFRADGVVRALEQQPEPFRVWVLPFGGQGSPPYRNHGNYLMHHRIAQAGGEHGNHIQRWGEFVGAGQQTYVDWHNFVGDLERLIQAPQGQTVRANFLAAANVRYIVSTLAIPGLPELYRGPEAVVYEVPGSLPRAWLAAETVVADTAGAALERFRDPTFDPARTAVLEAPLVTPLPGGPLDGRAEVLNYEPDEVRVRTEANRSAVLILADNHYPGWHADIDGEPAEVLRVDHTLRGVVVPGGRHEVVFRFHPADLYVGLWISIASTLIVLLAMGVSTMAARRQPAGG